MSFARKLALLLLMLSLPFHGWALASAPVCHDSGRQVKAQHCCAQQKNCGEHAAQPADAKAKPVPCDGGGACQCSSACPILPQPIGALTAQAPALPRADVHFYFVHADSAPPFRPPIPV